MQCKIYRGISGSGKSTVAKRNRGAKVFSTDDFWMKNGIYNFDPVRLPEAHQWCLRNFMVACQVGHPLIVADNTNVTLDELAPYVAVAQACGYDVEVITLRCPPEDAQSRNVHGVPLKTCIKRAEMLDQHSALFPRWWKHTIIETGRVAVARD